ncbi:MAG: DEAD/DEAH box helicase [Proteobacteria bacterium]|nr:DEAD/DEAH box helicase [Pseudomonadota bacterium]
MATRWKDCDIQQAIIEAAQRLGFASVREVQAKAITSIVAGKDVFVSLPTGTGKSLCFALVPLVFDRLLGYESGTESSIAIVVSPLIALMKDQASLTMTLVDLYLIAMSNCMYTLDRFMHVALFLPG